MAKDRMQQIRNILSDFGEGFKDDYAIGREDRRNAMLRDRKLSGQTEESTKWDSLMGTHPAAFRLQELTGRLRPEKRQALEELDMQLKGSTARKTGQMVGSVANDLTQDTTRSVYWLLNALQATGEVINEQALSRVVPELYQKSRVQSAEIPFKAVAGGKKVPRYLNMQDKDSIKEMVTAKEPKAKYVDGKLKASRGYSFDAVSYTHLTLPTNREV